MPLAPNDRLDHYTLTEIIGEGGMGTVWKARDTTLDRDVAIKVLPPEFSADPERLARFEREAKAVAALSHPNIVAIHGFGTHEGNAYAAIELLEGRALDSHLEDGPLPPRKALEIARQVATGLAAAHAKGIVHRDLKPANVFLSPDGRARILDFGLAAVAGVGGHEGTQLATATSLTNPGAVMGTTNYMSPEQVQGAPADSRTDIFALGTMLQEMLTGQKPFERSTAAETMTAVLREDAPEITLVGKPAPPAIAGLISRCLEKSPDERFQNASDLAFALGNASMKSGSSIVGAEPPARPQGKSLWPRIGMFAAVALFFAAGWLMRPAPPPTEPPRITQLTFSGKDHSPSVSPDGRLIAFTSSRTGASRIWLRQVHGGGEQPLTEGPDFRPRFSADGTTVTFIRSDGDSYAAYRVPVVGGQPRRLIDDVSAVDWSPDGRQLAFVRVPKGVDGIVRSEIGLFDVESGEQRIVHTQENKALFGLGWSPDGTRLSVSQAGVQSGTGSWRVLMLDPASGTVEELTIGDNLGLVSSAAWADASSLFVAVSESTVSGSALPNRVVRHDLRTGREQTLFWAPYLFPFSGSVTETTRLAKLDETSLVYDSAQRGQSLYEIDIEGETARELLGGVSIDRQPAYHPDGSRMLFTSSRTGNVDLFSYEFATGELLQLTDHPASDWDGAYTPDGKSILWSSERGGNLEIWTATLDGSNPRQITRDGVGAENPTMTADGQWIVYTSANIEHPGIVKIRADGSDRQQLATGDWTNGEVSPDGRFAFYLRTDEATLRSVGAVVDLASGETTPFTFEVIYHLRSQSVSYGRARWMPDGSAIAYVGLDEQGRTGLWVQDFSTEHDTAATRRRLIGFDGSGVHESFGISPDGKRILLSTLEQVRAIYMVEGLPEL